MATPGSPAQIKNYQALYQETQVELKDLMSKVNAAKSKGVNTPQYRFALNQFYNKQLENLDFLDKLNKLQGKNVNLKSQIDQVKKRIEFLKKAQAQAAKTTSKNVQNQTNKNIENMKSQQQANVANAQGEMKKKMDDYRMALRKWHEGGQKGPQPNPPGPVNLPNVQAPAMNVPANFIQPMALKEEIRQIVREILNEGKNPFEVVNYYLKSEPALTKKLFDKDNALLKRLASLDIEYNPEKLEVGKMFPWILNLWKKGDPVILGLVSGKAEASLVNKFKAAQELFNKGSFKKSIGITDVQKFKSAQEFIEKVNTAFVEPTELPAFANYNAEEINKDIKDGIIVRTNLSNDNFFIITPLKKKGACKYGNVHNKENQWCTSKDENNAFDSYKDGILYIFMDKNDNLKSKYQFFYKEGRFQFMDEYNRPFNYEEFFDENIDIFQKLFPSVVSVVEKGEQGDMKLLNQILNYFPKYYKEIYFKNIEKYSKGLLADLINISQGKINPKEFFTDEKMEDVVGFTYDDYTVYDDKIEIGCDLDSVDEDLSSYYWAYKNGYEAFEFNSDEFDYLNNYIKDEDKPKWIKVLKFLDKDFKESDFDEEGKIYKIISEGPAEKYFNRTLENFANKYEEAVNSGQDRWIDSAMKNSPFTISTYSITFEYKKTIDYCLKTSFLEPENFKDILENWMNKEGLTYDNYWDYYSNNVDYSEARNSLSESIDNIIEELENDEDFQATLKNKEKLDKFIKDLKFIKGYNDYHLDTDFARIKIKKINLEDNELYIQYFDLKNNQNHEGLISIDDLPKYSTVPMMFEVRSQIRKIIKDIF
jgi:hypothetical protein